ncbi:MAG: cation-translocating P-type ATPase, partial [Planctomycetales bacterium]|nr:cation-translocating P-type ATPase [Planctomycetales bacterium]
IVSVFLHEYTDAIVVMAIVVLNAILGFVQDYRAERALSALKKMSVPVVRVRREGVVREISSRKLVPGDILLMEVGNYVPCDCRLLETANFRVQESALTGESEPVTKHDRVLELGDLPLADRINMAYMGTVVSYGHAHAVVTATGMDTELGHIARSLQTVEAEPTPLQQRLARLGRSLAITALIIVTLVFVIGIMRGEDARLMLMTSLSLAVAVVPEGLPAVATVTLALGARRMFRRKALIRKLPAVETLGSVTVICSDKTGTLTENRMTVTVLDVAGDRLEMTEIVEHGQAKSDSAEVAASILSQENRQSSSLALLLVGAAVCNDAELDWDEDEHRYHAIGDPTEGALVVAGAQLGIRKDRLQSSLPRVAEWPFDSERKRMTTVHEVTETPDHDATLPLQLAWRSLAVSTEQRIAFTKGAVDGIVSCCNSVWFDNATQPLDDAWRDRVREANDGLASQGMRVLGVAFRQINANELGGDADAAESDLTFLGMIGMIDPPRAEVADAVARCRTAGIRPLMITGDHPLTAQHIAEQLHIAEDDKVLTGQDLEQIDDAQLKEIVRHASVFARVAPKHKLRLVKSLQDNGQIVAMTGDGVNDAPALKQAHIGVAMGITGTDVSKEAAQMVLLDDNFATIVNAVEEGRIVYDNIRKFVKYTMTSNAGEIWVMVLGPLLGMPLPLLPLQILWINLVTDGLPGLALAVEQAESNTMERPPYPPEAHIFDRVMVRDIAWIGLLMGVVSLVLGYWKWTEQPEALTHWRTIVFTVLTLSQMGNAMAIRSLRDSLFKIGVFSNLALVGSVLLTFMLQIAVIYWEPLQRIFGTQSLSWGELIACVGISSVVFWAIELQKLVSRRWAR